MGLVAERLNLRLFLDGIEVPVIGARCTFAEGTVAAADIQVIATDQVYDLLPRSFVTLFVYNNFDYVDDPKTGEKNAVRIGPNDLRRWVLLFAGELVSVSLQKEGEGRAATLTCADPSNYWDFIRQQYINFGNAGVEMFEAAFLGVKQDRFKFFDVTTQDVNSKVYVWLTQSKNANGKANIYLGAQRVLREMFFSVNDFYGEAFNRLRIGDTIVGLADDETAAKLFELEFFKKFIQERLDGAGGMVTARQLIDLLLGPVFHSYVTIPCPMFDRQGKAQGFKPPAQMQEVPRELTDEEKRLIKAHKEAAEASIKDVEKSKAAKEAAEKAKKQGLAAKYKKQMEISQQIVDEMKKRIEEIQGAAVTMKAVPVNQEDEQLEASMVDRSNSWPGSTLNYTVIRPDMWFMAPPMCNVVFPHMYRSLSFGRNYLAEPTRLFLRTSLFFSGPDAWLTERLYAPDFKSFNDLLYKQGGYLQRMAGTLLPHETYVGINPAMVWQEDVAAYVQKGPRREYLSQLTHYLFWKYKFGTRTVNVSGPLNLNLVPGYPALVVDRVGGKEMVTRHFIGNIASLVHSVDQTGGGWTHFSMAGARVHNEQIDFDDGGRSLEEVVSRGTDGFLDDRYDVEKIGPEVYQKLFGCDSIVDNLTTAERTIKVTKEVTNYVPRDLNEEEKKQIKQLTEDMLKELGRYRAVLEEGNLQAQQQLSQYLRDLYDPEYKGELGKNWIYMDPMTVAEAEYWLRAELEKKIDAIKAGATTTKKGTEEVDATADLVPLAVSKLHTMYASVVKNGQDVDRFTKLMTNRPKANFAELMGTDLANVPPHRSDTDEATTTTPALETMWSQDPDTEKYDGFWATAVNPNAKTTTENSYKANLKTETRTRVVTETIVTPGVSPPNVSMQDQASNSDSLSNKTDLPAEDLPWTNEENYNYSPGSVRTIRKTITETIPLEKQGKYPLDAHLNERRVLVQAYVDSLLLRGMRG